MISKNLDSEIWKDIPDFVDQYLVSNFGRIKSLSRTVTYYNKYGSHSYTIPERIMKPHIASRYLCIALCKDGKHVNKIVHRLVAQAFLEDYSDKLEVNHKDENKLNNHLDNLEMCTRIYNKNYGTGSARSAKNRSKAIYQIDKQNNIVKEWESINQASRETGICIKDIWRCCNVENATARGFRWRYKV